MTTPVLMPRKHAYAFVTHPEARRAIFNERRATHSLNLKWRTCGYYPDYDSGYKNALADLGMVMSIKLEYRDAELTRLRDALTAANQEIELLQDALRTARQVTGWMVEQ